MPGKPEDGQASTDGQQPPEMPSEDQGQTMPEKPVNAQNPTDGQQPTDGAKPEDMSLGGMIDFDALVESGTISRETCDKIKAYMEEHKPGDGQQPPEMPADGQQPPEMPADGQKPADGQQPDLLSDLLSAGIITQAEYDALSAAITVN